MHLSFFMSTEFELKSANNDCEMAAAVFTLAVQSREQLRILEAPVASALTVEPPMMFGADERYKTSRVIQLTNEDIPEEESLNRRAACRAIGSTEVAHDERLVRLAPGPWISLGGYLNYEGWTERERFLELDAAIAGSGTVKRGPCINADHQLPAKRRTFAQLVWKKRAAKKLVAGCAKRA